MNLTNQKIFLLNHLLGKKTLL